MNAVPSKSQHLRPSPLVKFEKERVEMKKNRRILCALLACVALAGITPVHAAEQTVFSDCFSIEHDAPKMPLEDKYLLSWGTADYLGESFYFEDTFHYAMEEGQQITVTNTNTNDANSVYVYCEVFRPQSSLVNQEGQTESIPGGYFMDIDKDTYVLSSSGQWRTVPRGYYLLGAAMETDGLLSAGESVTFSMPDAGTDAIYLLYTFYVDPAVTDTSTKHYTKYQYNAYRYTEPSSGIFSDVSTSSYYYDAVVWAVENGIANGTSATKFSPSSPVTRAQAATFLWRAAGSPEPLSSVSPFSDVTDETAYYYKAVLWAAEQGIVGGVGNGRFSTEGILTYEQILAMLCRADGGAASGSDWSEAAIRWAAEHGVTDGLDFSATETCPRSDVIYCLWK